jgi:hypothetical protein
MKKSKLAMWALVVTFGLALAGCLSTPGDPNQNIIGEVTGDNYAIVRAPASEVSYVTGGMIMPAFEGHDLTIPNQYKITRPFMGSTTIDLKVAPGNHEFTIVLIDDRKTLILTESYDFSAGKWYSFDDKFSFNTDSIPVILKEGTLKEGKPSGSAAEVAKFQISQVYNSDEESPPPPQESFKGNPGQITADKVTVTLLDGPQPGQIVLELSDGYKFGPKSTAAYIVEHWLSFPTYPITISPSHCIGEFNADGTRITITMKTSGNRTVTSGQVKYPNPFAWARNDVDFFLPKPSGENFTGPGAGLPYPDLK